MHSDIATRRRAASNSKGRLALENLRPFIQPEVQRVGCPSHLPRSEIRLAALHVEIGEEQKEQEWYHSGENKTGCN
jgi:hypothetical protein